MQGSVHRFDPQTGAGSVLLDDGTELAFGPEAFRRSGLRLVRLGQRLTLEVEPTAAGDPASAQVVAMRLQGI